MEVVASPPRIYLGPLVLLDPKKPGTRVDPEKPVTGLVTGGPFRYTRNPGYLWMTVIYARIASLVNALWAILLAGTDGPENAVVAASAAVGIASIGGS
jgi:hypothetical protein